MFWKRLATWLFLPASVLGALALGHWVFQPEFELEANQFDELLGVTPLERPEMVSLKVLDAEGQPAVGAVVVLLEPEVSVDYADKEGVVQLHRMVGGPLRLQAYLPGHDLYTAGPTPAEELPVLQLVARTQPQLPELAPERLVQHSLRLKGRDGERARGVQLIARLAEPRHDTVRPTIEAGREPSRYDVPWIAFADEDGWVELEGLPERSLIVRAYPVGLPEVEAWQLAEQLLTPVAEGESDWTLSIASWTWTDLPPNVAMQVERLDIPGKLPLRRVPADGRMHWDVLPPGVYRVTVDGVAREWTLYPGSNPARWEAGL